MLYGYRQLYSLHENRRHLRRHCKRHKNKIWYLKKSKKSKKIVGLMKDELRGKIIAELKY